MASLSFPPGFVWGAATASYQIEGAFNEDGRGLSVWDMMCRKQGAIWGGHTGDIACDHYHRFKEDVGLMRDLGLQAYRLSVSWSRILPEGVGKVNEKGLDFYDQLIDQLLADGITPYVKLFHWDFPYDLYCKGGWLNRDSADWFADYTRLVVEALSDRVSMWITQNEPQCFIGLGHLDGIHAPGDKLGWTEVLRAGHHSLLAHGKSVQAIRAFAKTPPRIGYAPVGSVSVPATDSQADIDAARTAMFAYTQKTQWSNTWFSDPVFFQQYPEDFAALHGDHMPKIEPNDMETIGQPLDFYAVNIYQGTPIRAGADGTPQLVERPIGYGWTHIGWPITPDCLYWGARFLYERYQKPIIITENGLANMDWIAADGQVHDPQRIDYLMTHLREFAQAGADGIPIEGYFQWSLLDNFEWAEGYRQRFGLVYVDYTTQRRIPKDSAAWYTNVIRTNGASLFAD
ncbi:MAG: GH1 family beta-glucosidase [Chloroflexota bacterium]|nr:GH1 family beta-glucosidase [Chloroflexota bacterium]